MKTLPFLTVTAFYSLFTAVNPAFAQGLTFTTNTLNVGGSPSQVVAADINGDGKPDLICNAGGITVLTNNGSGGFGSNATLNVVADCIAVADVNGDGKPDLICGIWGSSVPVYIPSALMVLTNNGNGVFGSNATYNVGNWPTCIAVADVNNDGKPDLIVASWYAPLLTVLTNNGSGGFGTSATLNVGSYLSCVVAADVNNDGKPDLISANNLTDTLSVLTNNGYGVFGSNATLTVGSRPSCVVAADVNGDGKLDLISANEDGTLTVLTNNGNGVLGSNATLNVGSTTSQCVVAADVNGDGKLDLICASYEQGDSPDHAGTLTVFTNNGSGVFGSNATFNVGSYSSCVVAADVNNDGKLDLISANAGTLTVLTQIIIGSPVLAITPADPNTLVLSWSSFSTSFTLQTNSDLTTTNWAPAGYTISTSDGTNQSTTITPPPTGSLFFRLKQ